MSLDITTGDFAGDVAPLRAWDLAGLHHGFLGRIGGVSAGAFAALNLSRWVGDDATAVENNWMRVRRIVPPGAGFALLNQVHECDVHVVDAVNAGERRRGDGMVTATANIMLGIFSADCVPILMIDAERRIAGAIHAGWRGVLSGIAGEGVRAMESIGAARSRIRAALGPSIGLCCFEVESSLAERFSKEVPGAAGHAREGKPGKAYLDLRSIVADQFRGAGLVDGSISNVGPCTKCANDRYFSRRGAGGSVTGLQLSFIGFGE